MGALVEDLRLCCPACGGVGIPSILDRQPLVPHLDPVTRRVCPNRVGAVMILRLPLEPEEC